MDAAVAALLGTLVGAAGSIGVVWLQQGHETKRARLRTAVDLALQDWKIRLEAAGTAYPIAISVLYQTRVLEAVADGRFSADTVRRLNVEQEQLIAAYEQVNEERRQALKKQREERRG
jgi:hypothetical protein